MTLTVPVILGSVRSDRIGIRAARFLTSKLQARGHAAPLVDPAELKLPLLDRMYKEYPAGTAPEPLERLAADDASPLEDPPATDAVSEALLVWPACVPSDASRWW